MILSILSILGTDKETDFNLPFKKVLQEKTLTTSIFNDVLLSSFG